MLHNHLTLLSEPARQTRRTASTLQMRLPASQYLHFKVCKSFLCHWASSKCFYQLPPVLFMLQLPDDACRNRQGCYRILLQLLI